MSVPARTVRLERRCPSPRGELVHARPRLPRTRVATAAVGHRRGARQLGRRAGRVPRWSPRSSSRSADASGWRGTSWDESTFAPHAGTPPHLRARDPAAGAVPAPRPSLGVLRISTGGSVPLDRGRAARPGPAGQARSLPANQHPHLLRVGGADRESRATTPRWCSRGWHVLVRDLGSTNGTTVSPARSGAGAAAAHRGPGSSSPGTVVTLADEVELTYEVQE